VRTRFAIATILAGVGLLASAWPAQAQIVYTPVNITIRPNTSYNLDVNNDGVTDFTITSFFTREGPGCHEKLGAGGALSETAASEDGALIGPLSEGDEIGPGQVFTGGTLYMDSFHDGQKTKVGVCHELWSWPWYLKEGTATGYLGLSFQLNGEIYYGWAQLSVNGKSKTGITAALTGYAYETTPGMPINAGQTE